MGKSLRQEQVLAEVETDNFLQERAMMWGTAKIAGI